MAGPITIYHRARQCYIEQEAPASKWMHILYETPAGNLALHLLIKRKLVSVLYGWYCRTPWSRRAVRSTAEQYHLDLSAYPGGFKNFREFFIRLREDVAFPEGEGVLGSPAEGCVSLWGRTDPEALYQVKDSAYRLRDLLGDEELAQRYGGGAMVRIRLSPHHYHHFHHFCSGEVTRAYDVKGCYYSVNPMAASAIPRLYCKNKRRVVQVRTGPFGEVLYVLVGATMIGSICDRAKPGDRVEKGEDGGYFAPGGSMILMLFEKDRLRPCGDLAGQTELGFETEVSIGDVLGEAQETGNSGAEKKEEMQA